MGTSKLAILIMTLLAAGLIAFGVSQFSDVPMSGKKHETHQEGTRE